MPQSTTLREYSMPPREYDPAAVGLKRIAADTFGIAVKTAAGLLPYDRLSVKFRAVI